MSKRQRGRIPPWHSNGQWQQYVPKKVAAGCKFCSSPHVSVLWDLSHLVTNLLTLLILICTLCDVFLTAQVLSPASGGSEAAVGNTRRALGQREHPAQAVPFPGIR